MYNVTSLPRSLTFSLLSIETQVLVTTVPPLLPLTTFIFTFATHLLVVLANMCQTRSLVCCCVHVLVSTFSKYKICLRLDYYFWWNAYVLCISRDSINLKICCIHLQNKSKIFNNFSLFPSFLLKVFHHLLLVLVQRFLLCCSLLLSLVLRQLTESTITVHLYHSYHDIIKLYLFFNLPKFLSPVRNFKILQVFTSGIQPKIPSRTFSLSFPRLLLSGDCHRLSPKLNSSLAFVRKLFSINSGHLFSPSFPGA